MSSDESLKIMREVKRFYARVSRKHSKTMKFELEKGEIVRKMDWICTIVQAVDSTTLLTACWLETFRGFYSESSLNYSKWCKRESCTPEQVSVQRVYVR